MTQLNFAAYRSSTVINHYRRDAELQPPERTLFGSVAREFSGRRILDIGVGSGRTTPHLLAISDNYVAVDYSPEMIERCRAAFPAERFVLGDARDLSRFGPGSFDLIVFSFNGIDYVGHEDRLTILAGIRRLLAPDGAFIFSAHNRNAPQRAAWDLAHFGRPLQDPGAFAKKLLTFPGGIVYHMMRRSKEVNEKDYAIINDQAHTYTMLTYYIRIEDQIEQLKPFGFADVRAVGLDGEWLKPQDYAARRDNWIYYIARPR